jgi:heme oxygenase
VVWRRFVSFLDAPGLSAREQDAVVAGARAAFERFGVLLKRHFALD